jgi:predicted DNA-binding transcriptional regulator AlpA
VIDIARQEIAEQAQEKQMSDREMTDRAVADQWPEEGFQSAVPVKRTTLFKMEKKGTFPASHYASANRRFWFADEIARWQANLPTNNRISR